MPAPSITTGSHQEGVYDDEKTFDFVRVSDSADQPPSAHRGSDTESVQ